MLTPNWKTTAARVLRRVKRPDLAPLRRRAGLRGIDTGEGVGGLWEKMGRLQFEFLVSEGLQPGHMMLDVGCGALRGGLHFVRFLDEGHYHGIDVSPRNLEAARRNLRHSGLADRRPRLRLTDTFDVDFGVSFDFALAQSVFTHLPLNSVRRCLLEVSRVLAPGGRFYATFFRAPNDPADQRPLVRDAADGTLVTYPDRNPYHYSADDLRWACSATDLEVTDLGEWGHPRGQEMMLFTKPA